MAESLELADLLRAMGEIPCDLRAGPKTRPDQQTIDTGTDTLAEREPTEVRRRVIEGARVVLTLREWRRVTPSLKVFGFLRLMELSLIDR